MSTNDVLQQIMEIMEQKELLAQHILDLTKQQAYFLNSSSQSEQNDLTYLETLLNKRQEYMERVNELDKNLSIFKQSGTSFSLEEKEHDISQIFIQAQKIDHDNLVKLKAAMSGLSARMKSLQMGKASTNTYEKKKSQVQGFFVDKKK
ncbi:MAG: hypothetical protein FH756_19485 [Firmicutes bacterium]|nr:hypothetical protein [Bacillota bacterium]